MCIIFQRGKQETEPASNPEQHAAHATSCYLHKHARAHKHANTNAAQHIATKHCGNSQVHRPFAGEHVRQPSELVTEQISQVKSRSEWQCLCQEHRHVLLFLVSPLPPKLQCWTAGAVCQLAKFIFQKRKLPEARDVQLCSWGERGPSRSGILFRILHHISTCEICSVTRLVVMVCR